MTTIAFDGKELVADSRAYKVKLDEQGQHSKELLDKTDGVMCKIVTPKTMTFGGEPVLAIGVAGDGNLIPTLKTIDTLTETQSVDLTTGEPSTWVFSKELTEDKFYAAFIGTLQTVAQMLVVTDTHFALVEIIRVPGTAAGKWVYQSYQREEGKHQWAMIGTGLVAIQEALKVPEKLGDVTLTDIQSKDARKCVQLGIICDKLSGGPLTVWSKETGISVVEVDAPIQAAKDLADEQPDGMLPIGDGYNAELDRRLEAIVAARQAA